MRFSCAKENLEIAVTIAERFTGKNITLPILANLLMEVEANNLAVTATNLEYAVQVNVPGKSSNPGKISIPAKVVSSFVQSIKEDKVDLEGKQSHLYLRTESRDTRINGLNPEEFPLVPKIKKTHSFTTEADLLQTGLEKVIPAVATSEFKPELAGVFWGVSGSTLKLASTDTFRLAEKTVSIGKKEGENFSFILPSRAAAEISRILQGKEEARFSIGENQIMLETEGVKVVSRLIEGNFPEYSGIIPKTFEATSFVNKDEFTRAIRAASIFSSKIQEVVLNFKGKILEINSANSEIGEHKITIPVSSTGKDLKVSFNYRYLLDGLSALDEEEIFIGVNNENTPSLLRNKQNPSFLYVVMPLRLS